MTKLDENLSKIFDVEPKVVDATQVPVELTPIANQGQLAEIQDPDEKDMEDDFAKLRKNQEDLMRKGQIALECALDVVQQSDQPRAIEVFSTLLGQLSKLNQEAMDLHIKRREVKDAVNPGESGPKTVNNNAIFVGSTAELSKMLTDMTGKKPNAT